MAAKTTLALALLLLGSPSAAQEELTFGAAVPDGGFVILRTTPNGRSAGYTIVRSDASSSELSGVLAADGGRATPFVASAPRGGFVVLRLYKGAFAVVDGEGGVKRLADVQADDYPEGEPLGVGAPENGVVLLKTYRGRFVAVRRDGTATELPGIRAAD